MSKDNHCQDVLSQFSDYIDGELKQGLCTELEKHLKECHNCRVVFNTMKKTIELYQAESPEQELPEKMRQRLFAKLNLEDYCKK